MLKLRRNLELSHESLSKIDTVFDQLEYHKPSKWDKFLISGWSLFLFLLVALSTFGLSLTLFTRSFFKSRAKTFKKIIPHAEETWYQASNQYFDAYKDVKEVNKATAAYKPIVRATANRGEGIPSDASIIEWNNGPRIILDKETAITYHSANWRWRRSSGKSTQSYYRKKLYVFIEGVSPKITKSSWRIRENRIFRGTGNKLENDEFNRRFSPQFSDELLIRILLTPYTQETLVKHSKSKVTRGFEVKSLPKHKMVLQSITIPQNRHPLKSFTVKTSDLRSRETAIKSLKEDFKYDLRTMVRTLKIYKGMNIFI